MLLSTSKRTRFALVFENATPMSMGSELFNKLEIVKAEGCEKEGKQFVLITVKKPTKPDDVLKAIRAHNADHADDADAQLHPIAYDAFPMVVSFDRAGNSFKAHPIIQLIQAAVAAQKAWSWSLLMAENLPPKKRSAKKKRAVSELESDLVETLIRPASEKRMHTAADAQPSSSHANNPEDQEKTKKRKKFASSYTNKKTAHHHLLSSADPGASLNLLAMNLIKEIARSKDETIQSKNQMIDLLMASRCTNCVGMRPPPESAAPVVPAEA